MGGRGDLGEADLGELALGDAAFGSALPLGEAIRGELLPLGGGDADRTRRAEASSATVALHSSFSSLFVAEPPVIT